MAKNKFYSRKTILLLVDFILLFFALFLALKLRSYFAPEPYFYSLNLNFWPFFVIFLFWLVVFYLFDLYDPKKIRSLAFTIYTLAAAVATSSIFSILFFYLIPLFITPKTVLLLFGLFTLALLGLWRYFWNQLFKTFNLKKKIAVVGAQPEKIKVLPEILAAGEMDYQMVGFLKLDGEENLAADSWPVLGRCQNLPAIISQYKIDELVTAFNYRSREEALKNVSDCLASGVKITELPIFYERVTGKVPVEYIDQIWFLYNLEESDKKFQELVQRGTDIFLSTLGLIFAAPFLPFIALVIKLDSPGPIFYNQERMGKNGKTFQTHKFRTMVDGAEDRTGPVWAETNDPRVTKIGRSLRKNRLDEIPQLVNVLKGEMSLVGPRPERPKFVAELEKRIPFYRRRHLVRPGLTGWAQIMYKYGSSPDAALEKTQYDLYYIKNRSLLLYFIILLRTIRIVVTQKGI